MKTRRHIAVPGAVLALGIFLSANNSEAVAQAIAPKPDALATYNGALGQFKAILAERRSQINAKRLPNLPGQAVYLARNALIGSYKDLTDAQPSRIGRPNKYGIPPAYFDADNEPLLDEYRKLFDIMEAPPGNAQNSDTPFDDVVDL